MKPTYMCVDGHTFDQPLASTKMGLYGQTAIFGCPICHTEDFEMIQTIVRPTYLCENGHTFDQPLTSSKEGPLDQATVYGCPTCYTQNFKKIQTPKELEDEERITKTCVTRLGKSIRGDMMVSFKCRLCSCEFESPISECSLSMTDNAVLHTITGVNILSTLAAHHKCPSPYCGVECEVTLNKEEIFEEETK